VVGRATFRFDILRFSLLLAAAVLPPASFGLAQEGPYRLLQAAEAGGDGAVDHLLADSDGRRLYIPRTGPNARITVYDFDTVEPQGEIPKTNARGGRTEASSGASVPANASPVASVEAAAAAMKRGDFQRASGMLEAVIASKPSSSPKTYIMLATCRSNLKQGAEAIEVCERGIKQHSRSPRLDEFYVSMLRAWAGKAEMKAKLIESVRRNPGSPVYMMALSALLLMEDPVEFQTQIEPLVKRAVLLRPLDPEAHYLYGRWACINAHNDVSIRELTRALELTHDNDRAKMQMHTFLGITYTVTHEPAKAELEYHKAMELDRTLAPFEPEVFMQYANLLQTEQRADESQKVIAELLRRAPTYGRAHLGRAQFLFDHDKLEEALAEGELALKYAGQSLEDQRAAHLFLAKTYHALGREDEAKIHQDWVRAHSHS